MKRNCEICKNRKSELVYTQKFVSIENKEINKHEFLHCYKCGFIFISNIIFQKKLDLYYKNSNKYLYLNQNIISPELNTLHTIFFNIVNEYFIKKFSGKKYKNNYIFDIGCGNGNLLNIFKNNKYTNILGLDPSKTCSLWAKKYFNIKIVTSTIDDYKTNKRFDVIILASVLEHISTLNKSLIKIEKLLKNDGILVTIVPDLAEFGNIMKEPFLEFSLEHINFFTKNSLSNLLGKYGFVSIRHKSIKSEYFGSFALDSICKKSKIKVNLCKDNIGIKKLQKYILMSQKMLKNVEIKIDKLVKTQEPVIVWGTGSLTSRLLGTTKFRKMNILEFIDKNTSLQGKQIAGKVIMPPNYLKGKKSTVFVSSFIYGKEIKNNLIKDYNYKGKVILI